MAGQDQGRSPLVTSITGLASGYFATMMHLPPGPPIALTTDGVGTKIMLAEEASRWEPIGVDCVANNVNDLICVGAVPLALLDYIATDRIDEGVLDEVARGLFLGAELAGIAIPGGEIAQIGEMLAKSASGGPTLDLVGTAIGALPPAEGTADGYRRRSTAARSARVTWSSGCRARACTATGTPSPGTRCSRRAA